MAKKKKSVKSAPKTEVKAVPVKAEKGNSALIMIIAVIVIALTAFESIVIVNNDKQMKKKPVLVGSYKAIYHSVICSVVYNSDYISIDEYVNQIQVQDKMTGAVKGIFEGKDGQPIWCAETKDGMIFAILKNSNVVWAIKNYKKSAEFTMADCQSPSGIVADSQDNLIIADSKTGKIFKYNTKGEKLAEFAGYGDGKDKNALPIGKIFIDAKDNVFALTGGTCGVKGFTKDGKFLTEFKLLTNEVCQLADIAPTPDGNLYINYFNGSEVLVYNTKGKLIGRFSKDVTGNFAISSPGTIAGGTDGFVYVGTYAVGVFNPIKY